MRSQNTLERVVQSHYNDYCVTIKMQSWLHCNAMMNFIGMQFMIELEWEVQMKMRSKIAYKWAMRSHTFLIVIAYKWVMRSHSFWFGLHTNGLWDLILLDLDCILMGYEISFFFRFGLNTNEKLCHYSPILMR